MFALLWKNVLLTHNTIIMAIAFLTGFLKLLVSLLINIFLIIPVFSLIFGLNEIRRLFVKLSLRKQFGGDVTLTNGADGANGFSSRNIIRSLFVFEKGYNFETLKKVFTQDVVNLKNDKDEFVHKKFRSRYVTIKNYSCWQLDKNFNANNHFRTLPEEQNMSESRLMELIRDLSEEMKDDRPQWEIIFVPVLPNPNECGVILRLHHSFGDGLSLMNVIAENLTRDKTFPYVIDPINFYIPLSSRILFNVKGYSMFGWTFLNGLVNKQSPPPDRHPEAPETSTHLIRTKLNLSELKFIQKKTGASVTSILMTSFKNALDYLNNGPLDLIAMSIVAKFPYPAGELANNITFLNVKVPNKTEDNWKSQLEAVNNETNILRNPTFFMNNTMNLLLGRMPTSTMTNIQKSIKGIFCMSNLPFVTRNIQFAGGEVKSCFVFPVMMKSVFVTALSIGDIIDFTIQSGANILNEEELELLIRQIKNQLEIMSSAK